MADSGDPVAGFLARAGAEVAALADPLVGDADGTGVRIALLAESFRALWHLVVSRERSYNPKP